MNRDMITIVGTLRESQNMDQSGFVWEVSILGEGPGMNSQKGADGKLYRENFTKESVNDLIGKLDGVKVKAFRFKEGTEGEKRDHLPIELDEYPTPGNNVGILEAPYGREVNGKLHAFATLKLGNFKDALWLRDMLLWARDAGHPDYLGLSINSKGTTRMRVVESTGERYLDVIRINRPKSVEVVDTAAAKGEVRNQFVRLIQSYNSKQKEASTSTEASHSIKTDNMNTPIIVQEENVKKESTSEIPTEVNSIEVDQTVKDHIKIQSEQTVITEPTIQSTIETKEIVAAVVAETTSAVIKNETLANAATNDQSMTTSVQPSVELLESISTQITKPLVDYLQHKQLVFTGKHASEIIQSLDMTTLPILEQAVLRQIDIDLRESRLNAAKLLVHELDGIIVRQSKSYNEVTPLETQTSAKTETLQESAKEDETLIIEDAQDMNTKVSLIQESVSANQADTLHRMDEKTQVTQTPETPVVTPVITETPKETTLVESKVSVSQPVSTVVTEKGDDSKLIKLMESIAALSVKQDSRVEALEKQIADLAAQNTTLREAKDVSVDLKNIVSEWRSNQEHERMTRILESSGLMPEVQDKLKKQLGTRVVQTDELNEMINDEKQMLNRLQESAVGTKLGNVFGLGFSSLRTGADSRDKLQVAMYRLFGVNRQPTEKNQAWEDPGLKFSTLRQGYSIVTGDYDVTGEMNQRYIREGVIGPDTFEQTLSNTMYRYMVQWYDTFDHSWRKFIRIRRGIRDFKMQEMNRIGGFSNLQIFNESQANPSPTGYIEATPPVEQGGAFRPRIRAKMFTVSEEMIKNDDLFVITRLLEESARAADETLMTFAFGLLVGGATYLENNRVDAVPSTQINTDDIYSGANLRKLYASDNSDDEALGYTSLLTAINQMKRMRKIGNGKPLRLTGKKYLIVPLQLENTAQTLHPANTAFVPGSNFNDANILPKDLEIIAVDSLYLGDDPNNWYLVEDPIKWEGVQIGFVDDEENPRIVLANAPTGGRTFSHGGFQYSVSHRYGGGIPAHEGIYGSFPTNP